MSDGTRTRIYLKERHEKYNADWLNLSGFVQTMLDLLVVPDHEIPEDERPEMPLVPAPLSQVVDPTGADESNPLSDTDPETGDIKMDQTEAARLVLAAAAGLNSPGTEDPAFGSQSEGQFAENPGDLSAYHLGISRRMATREEGDSIPALIVPFDVTGEGLAPEPTPPSVATEEAPEHAEGRETVNGHVLADSEKERNGRGDGRGDTATGQAEDDGETGTAPAADSDPQESTEPVQQE
jgi:hypothetical protein